MSGLPGEYDFVLYRGDTCSFSVTYSEGPVGSEVPQSLTGATLRAQAREKKADVAATASFTVTADADQVTNTGLMEVSIDAVNSDLLTARRYFWDLEITWPSGQVQTILAGVITVTQDATR